MSENENNQAFQCKKSDKIAENRFSHLTADVCVYVRLHVCVKGLGRNERRDVLQEKQRYWRAETELIHRESQEENNLPEWIFFKKREGIVKVKNIN